MRCPDCPSVLDARALFVGSLWPNVATVVAPLAVFAIAAVWIARRRLGPVAGAGTALGIGLGGFVDGIVLHQLLQWHSMFASVVPPTELVAMKFNMIWDGLFHAFTWVVSLAGVVMLFQAGRAADARWSARVLAGSMLAGWGAFNLVEGVLDHLVLGIHHVRPGSGQLAWDLGFVLAGGLGFLAVGLALARGERSSLVEPRHG